MQMKENASVDPVDVCNLRCGFVFSFLLPRCLICNAPAACVQLPQAVSTVGALIQTLLSFQVYKSVSCNDYGDAAADFFLFQLDPKIES